MQSPLSFILLLIFNVVFKGTAVYTKKNNPGYYIELPNTINAVIEKKRRPDDTIIPAPLKPYTIIEYDKKELLHAAPGTKSVLFNNNGSKLYAITWKA